MPAMTNVSTMASFGRILAAPWQQRRNQHSRWVFFVTVGLMALGPVAMVATGWRDHHVMVAAGCLVVCELAVLLGIAWAYLAASVLEQNRAVAARLVPGHVRALRRVMGAGWAVTAAGMTALVAPLVGMLLRLQLPGLALAEPTLLVLAGAALVAGVVAAAVRWQQVWLVACFTPVTLSALAQTRWGPLLGSALLAAWQAAPWPLAVAAVVAGVVLCIRTIQAGGSAHARNYDARKERLTRLHRRAIGVDEPPSCDGLFGRFARLRMQPFQWWMRRLNARPETSPMARLALAAGPGAHWTTQFVNLALLVAGAVVVVVGVAMAADQNLASALLNGWAVGGVFAFTIPALQAAMRLHRQQREQALLVLLPGVPRGAALNRALSLRFTAQFLSTWLIGLAVLMPALRAASWLDAGGAFDTLSNFAWPAALSMLLPVGPALWRRWARMAPPTQLSSLRIFGLPALASVGAFALAQRGVVTHGEIAAAFIAVSLAWCALRWLRMGREPTAFPVGRLHR